MAKKRKTRSQKYAADLRQHVSSSLTTNTAVSLSEVGIQPLKTSHVSSHSNLSEYHFVRHDLIKTSTITGAIILVELVLFFVVKL